MASGWSVRGFGWGGISRIQGITARSTQGLVFLMASSVLDLDPRDIQESIPRTNNVPSGEDRHDQDSLVIQITYLSYRLICSSTWFLCWKETSIIRSFHPTVPTTSRAFLSERRMREILQYLTLNLCIDIPGALLQFNPPTLATTGR